MKALVLSPEETVRFWGTVDRGAPDACWPWNGALTDKGYGQFRLACCGAVGAHQVAYFIERGRAPDGTEIMHSCDVRACCNPRHLTPGTHADNMADMVAKGRQAKGEVLAAPKRGRGNPRARLTDEAVTEIRRRRAAGEPIDSLAAAYGVSGATIVRAAVGRGWRHVDAAPAPKMTAQDGQRLGAAAKHRKTMDTTLPAVVLAIRELIGRGEKPTQRACRSIAGYNSIQRWVPQSALVAMAEGES